MLLLFPSLRNTVGAENPAVIFQMTNAWLSAGGTSDGGRYKEVSREDTHIKEDRSNEKMTDVLIKARNVLDRQTGSGGGCNERSGGKSLSDVSRPCVCNWNEAVADLERPRQTGCTALCRVSAERGSADPALTPR